MHELSKVTIYSPHMDVVLRSTGKALCLFVFDSSKTVRDSIKDAIYKIGRISIASENGGGRVAN